MGRILRTIPFASSVVILVVAIVAMRWAIGCPIAPRLAAAPTAPAEADDPTQTPPRLLPTGNAAGDPMPISTPSPVVFTADFPADQSAAESTGPNLTAAPELTESVPVAETPSIEPLTETPTVQARPANNDARAAQRLCDNDIADRRVSPLPMLDMPKDRSMQLERVARQADQQIRHGIELADRRAYLAARSEFISALRLVAEGLDTEHHTTVHGHALAASLTAMKEAEDFLPLGSRLESDLGLSGIINSHDTPVLKDDASRTTSMVALRAYHTYAQEHLATAAGREVAGSMALHALGKLHSALAQQKRTIIAAPETKAVVFFQAALLVYPNNHMAANDLGVLLARCGNSADARTMLEHSASLSQQTATWQNLAVVYRQLGQPSLANRASQQAAMLHQAELAKQQTSPNANSSVQWVDAQTFAQTSANAPNGPIVVPSPTAQPASTANRPAAERTGPVVRNAAPPDNTRQNAAPISGYPGPMPANRAASDSDGPAPTPAAAERMRWGTPPYQR